MLNTPVSPLGYDQITDLSAAVGLGTIPAGATCAVLIPETQSVRFRDDGVAPTAGVGMLLVVNVPYVYTGNLEAIEFIQASASAKLNIAFYSQPSVIY